MARTEPRIWQIVACNEKYGDIEKAARLQREKRLVSVGWADAGDLTKLDLDDRNTRNKLGETVGEKAANCLKRFKWLSPKDWVILHKNKKQVACVGKVVDGKYKHNTKNLIGNGKGFGYSQPNQVRVKWKKSPVNYPTASCGASKLE